MAAAGKHAAVQEGADLLAHLGPDRLWQDFMTLAGPADEWPTAYIGLQLLAAGCARARLLPTARALAARQRDDGGWAYNARVPTDADSTAYCLVFLAAFGDTFAAEIDGGLQCLGLHQHADGGVATYSTERDIRAFMNLDRSVSLAGWTQPHMEVTAAAGLAFARCGRNDRAAACWDFVEAARSGGCWQSYWWRGPHLPTWIALELARALGHDSGFREDAAAALLDRGDTADCPFRTALAVLVAKDTGLELPRRRASERLAAQRWPDGLWRGRPSLQIPPPGRIEPRSQRRWRREALGTGVVISDRNGFFTTATALAALAA